MSSRKRMKEKKLRKSGKPPQTKREESYYNPVTRPVTERRKYHRELIPYMFGDVQTRRTSCAAPNYPATGYEKLDETLNVLLKSRGDQLAHQATVVMVDESGEIRFPINLDSPTAVDDAIAYLSEQRMKRHIEENAQQQRAWRIGQGDSSNESPR